MTSSTEERLGEIPIFADLSKRERKKVSSLMTLIEVPAGRTIIKQGDVGREFMIILEGEAEVRRDGTTIATLGPGDFLGELAVLSGAPRTADVVATSPIVLETLNRREFMSLLDESASIAKKILIGEVRRLHDLETEGQS